MAGLTLLTLQSVVDLPEREYGGWYFATFHEYIIISKLKVKARYGSAAL